MKKIYTPATDPELQSPVIDLDEMRTRPDANGNNVPYRFIHGYFEGTSVKFGFSFPEKDRYEGRFFQHLSPFPGPDEEIASQVKSGEGDAIAFALTHGAAFVETNMGSRMIFGGNPDPTIIYRSSAASAAFCRKVAQDIYGEHRMYGYCFGGSGGGYKTMSCLENTNQFDGAVPFVIGSPMSLPNCLTVCANGARQLRHCWPRILDAVEVGGSGKPYDGLTDDEKKAYRELVHIGFPPRMLITFATPMADGSLPVLTPGVKGMDGTYFEDFWTKPGYEGYEQTDGTHRDRTKLTAKVVSVGIGAAATREGIDDRNGTDTAWQKMLTDGSSSYIELTDVPTSDYLVGIDMIFLTGKAAGKKLRLGAVEGKKAVLGVCYGTDDPADVLRLLKPGDEVFLDNSDYIAIQLYHRHQVPEDRSFHAWDQYRDEKGEPIGAQRPVIAYDFTAGGCGSVQDGHVQGKVIIMNSLMDGDFPWQADWYYQKVREVNGDADIARVYYNDNCPHGDVTDMMGDYLHYTPYLGMLCQALLDVSAWVEKGIAPPLKSGYRLVDNQVVLAETAEERQGLQPVVTLTANGADCVTIQAGETVDFTAHIGLTEKMGQVELVGWSFEGEQTYAPGEVTAAHRYNTPGVYFPTVHVTANRNPGDPYTKLRNLARMRVIVK